MVSSLDEKANISEKGLLILKSCFYLKSIDPPMPLGSQRLWRDGGATNPHMLPAKLSGLYS
jgi:hypothetical protein